MESLSLALVLIAGVLISSVVDQLIPRVSLPLVQIAIGLAFALLTPSQINITLDPELFLVLFIAPLLFDEAKSANKAELWKERKPVLSLAIGLVVATALIIGFTLHLIIPSIPLAAAFALGAALGPTDAVAVTSLSKTVDIPKRQKSILKGELLLNDASGIVSFQFALAAVITGSFSLLSASASFVYEFIGGLAVGAALGLLANFIVRRARDIGVENTTFHVLFEVFTPFVVYLVSDAVHVSGIIAVVVAGLLNVISPRAIGPSISRMNIVSSSVWRVLAFALNGVVFVLLGTQLPNAMRHTWDDVTLNNGFLLICILGVTLILYLIRFLWVAIMDARYVRKNLDRKFDKHDAKMALVTTFCGAKGTITLSILFTIPYNLSLDPLVAFPQRDLIIFLACGVIVCTLLVATFVVPLLSPKPDKKQSEVAQRQREAECNLEIMRNVIEELTARQTPENRLATQSVIASYNDRMSRIKDLNDIEDEQNIELRIQALHWEEEHVFKLMEDGEVSPVVAYSYLSRLGRTENLLRHESAHTSFNKLFMRARATLHRGVLSLVRELPDMSLTKRMDETRKLQIKTNGYVIGLLEILITDSATPTEDASRLLLSYQRSLATLKQATPSVTAVVKTIDKTEDVKRLGYQLELEQIQLMYEDEQLSRATARRMRENVYLMQMDLEDSV